MAESNKKSEICSKKKKKRDKGYSWQKRFNVANWIAYLLISKYKHAIQLALSKNSYLNIWSFSTIRRSLKALGICAEGFRIKTDFLYEVRW